MCLKVCVICSGIVLQSGGIADPHGGDAPGQAGCNYHSSVRQDYAGRLAGKYKGTLFTAARVELVMSQKDPGASG
ncbi:hypothetical protein ACLQ18_44645 [Streptomyces sp. DT193]|uniref:hypothetical protein n=1 Tax=Streptomyces sp. DT193 TaxID=3393418 RepID=UPI003CF4183D